VEHLIPRESLERFAAGAATREEGRTIAIHLLKGCATCAATLRNLERGLRAEVQAPSGMLTVLRAVLKKPEHRLEEMLARR
jgi:hypothetical protein